MAETTTSPVPQAFVKKVLVSTDQAQSLQIRSVAGAHFQLTIDGVAYTGQPTIRGKSIRLVRNGNALLLQVEGQAAAALEISDFFDPPTAGAIFVPADPVDTAESTARLSDSESPPATAQSAIGEAAPVPAAGPSQTIQSPPEAVSTASVSPTESMPSSPKSAICPRDLRSITT